MRRNRPEDSLHKFAVQYLRLSGADGIVWWHTENEGKRTGRGQARFKAMGGRAGVPDLAIVLPGGRIAILELKAEGSYLSPDQRAFRTAVETLGAPYAVARSPEDVVEVLTGWGALRGSRHAVRAAA